MSDTEISKLIEIDSVKGGYGDIWMRLVSFYSVAALLPDYKFKIKVPPAFKNLAAFAFGDRLIVLSQKEATMKYTYTSLGIKDLLKPIIKGQRFITPYQKIVIHDRGKKAVKNLVNNLLFGIADFFELVQVPKKKWVSVYQGYLEIVSIKKLRCIDYAAFTEQMEKDYSIICSKLQANPFISKSLVIPADLSQSIVIFPTGTGRQFIPVWWAKLYQPDAYYAFFFKDKEKEVFSNAELKTLVFKEPEDIIYLSQLAEWAISTDSFPSHLLQSSSNKCTILITGSLRARIISPVFRGDVVNAEVTCYPCLHMDKGNHPVCAAGYKECLNWTKDMYTQNILHSIKKSTQSR